MLPSGGASFAEALDGAAAGLGVAGLDGAAVGLDGAGLDGAALGGGLDEAALDEAEELARTISQEKFVWPGGRSLPAGAQALVKPLSLRPWALTCAQE